MSEGTFSKYLSNFSEHQVEYEGASYLTAEHAYHCQRYEDPAIISEIFTAPTARAAWETSQKYKSRQNPEFTELKVEIMKKILRAKADQHEDVRRALLESGEQEIVKNEPNDSFWGNGPDGSGRNELGKLWMSIRAEIAAEQMGEVQ